MADSLLDIGGEPIFEFTPNWASRPKQSFQITRYLNQYSGTATEISEKNPEVPIDIEAQFEFPTKEDEYNFLTFIHGRIGRVNRFWFKWPKQLFTIKTALSNGSTQIIVHKDNSSLSLQGYERIYLDLSSGDTITRHVTTATLDDPNEEVELDLATGVDRDIAIDEVLQFGRILLVRLDEDLIRLSIENNFASYTTLRFHELVKEYSELAANP